MLVNNDAHQRETIPKWPFWLALKLRKKISKDIIFYDYYLQNRIYFHFGEHSISLVYKTRESEPKALFFSKSDKLNVNLYNSLYYVVCCGVQVLIWLWQSTQLQLECLAVLLLCNNQHKL